MAEDEGEDAAAGADGAPQSKQVYVRSNKLRTSVDELTAFFAAVGKPTSITNKFGEVPPDGLLREVALVTFRKNKAVQKAIGLSGGTVGGKSVVIGLNTRPPQARGQAAGSVRAYVGGLPYAADDAAVRAHFASCGKILFVRFCKGADGEPTGAAFVIFEDADGQKAALRAAVELDGTELGERKTAVAPAAQQQNGPKHSKKKKGGAGGDGDGGAEDRERKRFRPSEWRHDKATGLTLPRGGAPRYGSR